MSERVQQRIGLHRPLSLPAVCRHTHTQCRAYGNHPVLLPFQNKHRPSQKNYYRPVALTSLVMKCLERVLLRRISTETSQFQDRHQFAYRRHRSTEDAILTRVHNAHKHLDTPRTSARILFLDFSSAFNTTQPYILLQKLRAMLVNPSRKWILDFLANRKQWVKINNTISSTITTNSGAL